MIEKESISVSETDEFHKKVGKLIMRCQFIEHDIKWIYAGLLSGDLYENFDKITNNKETLGSVIFKLRDIDVANFGYFSRNDYRLLSSITRTRNYWAHEAYLEFMYERGEELRIAFLNVAARLNSDYEWLFNLSKRIEKVRLDVLRRFNRI